MKKKNALVVLEFGGLLTGFALRHLPAGLCVRSYEWGGDIGCFDKFPIALSDSLFVFAPAMFFFSLITYKMREAIFISWARFTYVWVPLSMMLILISDDSPGHLFVSAQEFVAMLLWGLYIIISLIIIVWKYLSLRRNSEQN